MAFGKKLNASRVHFETGHLAINDLIFDNFRVLNLHNCSVLQYFDLQCFLFRCFSSIVDKRFPTKLTAVELDYHIALLHQKFKEPIC